MCSRCVGSSACAPTVTHFGLATIQGRDAQALRHLRTVTGLSPRDARVLIEAAFELWHQRSRLDWALDLGILRQRQPPPAGISLAVHDRDTDAVDLSV